MTRVKTRLCGPSQTAVPMLALGSWHTWDRAIFEDMVVMLKEGLDAGVSLFDIGVYRSKGAGSIDPYDHPTDLVFSYAMNKIGAKAGKDYNLGIKAWLHRQPITEQVENLLWRQGTDSAQYLVLGDILEPIDTEALLTEIETLIKSGKVQAWAVNNWSASEIGEIADKAAERGIPVPQFAQLKYSVFRRSVAEGKPFTDLMTKYGISIQASDVMEGGLAFPNDSTRIIAQDVAGIQIRIRDSRERFARAAALLDATPAQVAIAFPLTNPACVNVLIGTRTLQQFRDNLGAFALLERETADSIRSAVDDLWLDKDVVDANSSWSQAPGDERKNYTTVRR